MCNGLAWDSPSPPLRHEEKLSKVEMNLSISKPTFGSVPVVLLLLLLLSPQSVLKELGDLEPWSYQRDHFLVRRSPCKLIDEP